MTAARVFVVLALAAAIAGGLYLAFGALSTSLTCLGNGCVTTHSTMVDDNGLAVVLPLLAPSLVPLILLALMESRAPKAIEWSLVIIAVGACIVAIFSVGAFYLPSALLCWCAVALDRRQKAPQPA